MAYTKKLATIVLTDISGGTFTVTDTLECPMASSALASLQSHNDAYVRVGDDLYWIPASGVANIKVSYEDSEEIERPDPYGCDDGGDDDKYDSLILYLECGGGTTIIGEGSTTADPKEIWDFLESHNTVDGSVLASTDVTIYVGGSQSPYTPVKYEPDRPGAYWTTGYFGLRFRFYEESITCEEDDG